MIQLKLQIKLWLFFYFTSSIHSARILGIFPVEGRSHFNFHEAIMKSLLSAGHQVILIAPFQPQNSHENFTVIDSRAAKPTKVNPWSSVIDPNQFWFYTDLFFMDLMEEDCSQVVSLDYMKALENFDVIFVEALSMYQCYLPIAKKLGIPVIGTLSTRSMIDADYSVGISRFPSVFPTDDELLPRYRNPKLTFYEKITNFLQELQIKATYFLSKRRVDKFNEKYFRGVEWWSVKFALLFVNDHEIFLPRPKPPNAINIGGIHVKWNSLKQLPEDLEKFIEEATHGVIFFSLGSLAPEDIVCPELKNTLKKTFAKIPQRVIWKSNDDIEGLSENVWLSKWVPQKEVLAHKNVLAFISHCGLGSTYESIYFGKPMILIPIFADQPSNAAFLDSLEVGLYIDFLQLNEVNLLDAINKIINETKYRENMAALSNKFKTEPKAPAELVVYWTEYVLRHKGTLHLRTTEADMPLYQFLLLDVIIVILFVALISVLLFYLFIKTYR